MKIAIDIDDTLTKVDRVTPSQQYITQNGLSFQLVNPDAHAIRDIFDWTQEDVMRFIWSGGSQIFTNAPARQGAKEVIEELRKAGHRVTILTARSSDWFSDPVTLSREQLERNRIPYDELVVDVYEKGKYCVEHDIEVLIEDNFDICKTAQELGIKAVMFLDKHNLSHKDEIAYTVSDWEQVAQTFGRILGLKK